MTIFEIIGWVIIVILGFAYVCWVFWYFADEKMPWE